MEKTKKQQKARQKEQQAKKEAEKRKEEQNKLRVFQRSQVCDVIGDAFDVIDQWYLDPVVLHFPRVFS